MSDSSFRRRILAAFLTVLIFFGAITFSRVAALRESAASPSRRPTVILDAGHGGRDSGAVGVNGALEKNLNLAVAEALRALLVAAGVEVVMTRYDDRLLYTEAQDIPGKRKYYDLENRRKTAEMHPGAVFVSLHMNKYAEEKYKGLQVWCADDPDSRTLAGLITESIRDSLQPDNRREVKTAGKDIYLLHHAVGTAVLVECGFLSNREECEKLCDEDYRKELSFSIFCAIIKYLDGAADGISSVASSERIREAGD